MTTATPDTESETPALPGFEDLDLGRESATAEAKPLEVAAEIGAWPETAEPDITSETESTGAEVAAEPMIGDAESTAPVRVLIVDDESAMCAMTSAIVESMGYQPITVSSGEEAIETYREHRERNEVIQAVIMDLALPGGMSGLEATDALREIDDRARVIATSGYLQQNARTAAIERGFAGILPKPYTAERLTAELRWVVTRRGR